MALPHMSSAYTNRRSMYEAAIQRRRHLEEVVHNQWLENSNYFQRSNLTTARQAAWTSPTSFQHSMDAFKENAKSKDTKASKLKIRRAKIAALYQRDMHEWAKLMGVENVESGRHSRVSVAPAEKEDMLLQLNELKAEKEEERKKVADQLLYEHWRENSPDIRQMESRQFQEHVKDHWSDQVNEIKRKQFNEKRKEAEEAELAQWERERAAEREAETKAERAKNEEAMYKSIAEQIEELKIKQQEADELKKIEDQITEEQIALEAIEEKRKEELKRKKQQEHSRILRHQHAAKLRQRSQQVQKELEEDKKLLASLAMRDAEDKSVEKRKREEAIADVEWMKQVIDEQLQLEKEREAELNQIYASEAEELWKKREAEWERENQARTHLMNQVLSERRQQLQTRAEKLKQERALSIAEREKMLKDLETARKEEKEVVTRREEAKKEQKLDLLAQMSQRRQALVSDMAKEEAIEADEERQKAEYQALLAQELENIKHKDVTDVPGRRTKRQAWM